ncbi:1,6-anhydro-N-acetylmuramyl-L-alanine amidase AmpD [Pragia fontium]|uniref:1,6-anhydro-N-acetylmuramyl-L-alanine amidase AmpD n=1 Tax=Pragia fontium TaxID=82985 RepID=A0ABQ5LI24_9GAMM|nr:1,6-anhydro-N-acetylmuramyl-L-alanine amidase AmpD [Pragia fontium]GKX63004.1 N-acetyl-anhydromuranmyl-L-alanine amidase [Pragia fontium]SUB81704.1 1,6-anhydro-N-acetylmuramyl-L-alanine amidase AmpD [Pragia fontium]
MELVQGWIDGVKRVPSPHFDERPAGEIPSLLVIHNISLPPAQFGGPYIDQLFTGTLDANEHPYFAEICHLRVSAHCLIRRDGEIIQYVPFDKRAWHAGVSLFQGRERCNDFSIGIEMEGTDDLDFTPQQYQSLNQVTRLLMDHYPITSEQITGHCDIAPGRKTDPGPHFDWKRYKALIAG